MQRRYFVRHKEITIEEIEGLVAVRADPQAPIDAQRQLEVMRASLPVDTVATTPRVARWRRIARWQVVIPSAASFGVPTAPSPLVPTA